MNETPQFPFDRLFALKRKTGDETHDDKGTRAALRGLLHDDVKRKVQGQMAMGRIGAGAFVGDLVAETVAGLFGFHPMQDASFRNFGATCRRIRDSQSSKLEEAAPFDSHFRRLLSARTNEEACEQVRRIAHHAASKEIPINYENLFFDLKGWDSEFRGMLPRQWWTRTYFHAASTEDQSQPTEPAADD
jgi:CRISPR type I-E-associated protein CasB/Cse2